MTRLGKFELIEAVGRGGFGEVWKAREAGLDRFVALKFLTGAFEPEDRERFTREAQLAAKLSHPNIVAIHELGTIDGRDFLSMPLIEGQPLSRLRLEVREALRVIRDAARAVAYAHEQGIIHRDLKPANLMMESKTGHVWVLDFGLAKSVKAGTTLTVSGNIVGTPRYMAPEQARALPTDVRTDVYGLGATLYELVACHAPFDGDNVLDVLRQVESEEPPAPRADRDIVTIIQKAMEKEPARRYAGAADFADDIDRYLNGEPIRARRSSLVYRMSKRIRKEPVLYAMATLLVAAITTGSAFGIVQLVRKQRALQEQARAERDRADAIEAKAKQERRNAIVESAMVKILEAQEQLPDPTIDINKIKDKLKEAEAKLEGGLREFPGDQRMMYWMGRAHDLGFEATKAEAWYTKAIDADPHEARARLYRARLRMMRYFETFWRWSEPGIEKQGEKLLEAAREDLTKAGRESVPGMDESLLEAYRLNGGGRLELEELRKRCEVRVAQGGRTEEYWFLLGVLAPAEGKWDDCVARQTTALERHPRHVQAYFLRGVAKGELGDFRGAIKDCTEAIELRPDYALAYDARGAAEEKLGDLREAIEDFTKAIELLPDSSGAYYNRGVAKGEMGDFKGAIKDWTEAIELWPNNAKAYSNRGLAKSNLGDPRGAIEDCTKAIDLQPNYADAYGNRGAAKASLGDLRGAAADFEKALDVAPADWPYRAAVQRDLERARRGAGQDNDY